MNIRQILIAVVIGMIAVAWLIATGSAADNLPDGVDRWIDQDCGLVCYVFPDGSGHCYDCLDCVAGDLPVDPVPTDRPNPTPIPSPEPTEKVTCNRGLGNGSENCDPGNSGGRPGAAGEDNDG